MLMRLYVTAIHGSSEQGEYCSSGSAAILITKNRDINYLLYVLLYQSAMALSSDASFTKY